MYIALMFDTPIDFCSAIESNGITLNYYELGELVQGGPQVGNVTVNKIEIPGQFGGPPLINENAIYLPMLFRSWWGDKTFKLAKIDVRTFTIYIIEKKLPLIFLHKTEGNEIYYFEDLDATSLSLFNLNQFKRTFSLKK